MIIAVKRGTARGDVENLPAFLEKQGVRVRLSEGASQTVPGLAGDTAAIGEEGRPSSGGKGYPGPGTL